MLAASALPLALGCMADAIRARSEAIRHPGTYIGFFEWIAWSRLRNVRVHLLFGENVVCVNELFAPALPPLLWTAVHRVVAVEMGKNELRSARMDKSCFKAGVAGANHFVIGVCVPGLRLKAGSLKTEGPTPRLASRAALKVQWMLKQTAAQGDCGIDVMAFHSRRPRTAPSWKTIRKELADFMFACSERPEWQEVYFCCEGGGESGPAAKAKQPTKSGDMGPPPPPAPPGKPPNAGNAWGMGPPPSPTASLASGSATASSTTRPAASVDGGTTASFFVGLLFRAPAAQGCHGAFAAAFLF